MRLFNSLATGLIALLSADVVIAGPCRVSSVTSVTNSISSSVPIETETSESGVSQRSATSTFETASTTESVFSSVTFSSAWSSATELSSAETEMIHETETSTGSSIISASVTETTLTEVESFSASSTIAADTTTTEEAISTSTEIASTTAEVLPALPTIANSGFDNNINAAPWTVEGPASPASDSVFPKRSEPNVMRIRDFGVISQTITGLRRGVDYRIRFYWVKFDTPLENYGCRMETTFGGVALDDFPLLPPRTPDDTFEEFVSMPFQSSTEWAELKISIYCQLTGGNRFLIDDVSIELA